MFIIQKLKRSFQIIFVIVFVSMKLYFYFKITKINIYHKINIMRKINLRYYITSCLNITNLNSKIKNKEKQFNIPLSLYTFIFIKVVKLFKLEFQLIIYH